MTYDIFWSERALEEYKNLISYLLEEWGVGITDRIILNLIKRYPVSKAHRSNFLF